MLIRLRQLLRRGRGQEGAVALEFALCLPILLMLIAGSVDFGHAYYMSQVISNASREGARYGVKYKVDSGTGLPFVPNALTPSISDYVKLPAGLNYDSFGLDTLVVTGSYTGESPNKIITVTVQALKRWWLLGSFNFYGWLPLTNPQTLTAKTAMVMER